MRDNTGRTEYHRLRKAWRAGLTAADATNFIHTGTGYLRKIVNDDQMVLVQFR